MWIAATLIAALAQTMRNAAQADLTSRIGTMGATGVRFLFGLPFAVLFLGVLAMLDPTLGPVPRPGGTAVGYAAMGAVAQIAATALMLAAMRRRGFAVATALIKTEPVTLAIMAAVLLGEALTPARLAATQKPLYRFLLNKWYFDELYDAVFVRTARWLGRALWHGGDGRTIDGAINGVAMGLIPRVTRFAGRVQSGYLFHYAFGMVIGLVGLLIWVMTRGTL